MNDTMRLGIFMAIVGIIGIWFLSDKKPENTKRYHAVMLECMENAPVGVQEQYCNHYWALNQ